MSIDLYWYKHGSRCDAGRPAVSRQYLSGLDRNCHDDIGIALPTAPVILWELGLQILLLLNLL